VKAPFSNFTVCLYFGDCNRLLFHGRLHFIDEKAKVNAKYYVESLLRSLVADYNKLLPGGFIFQQDGAPAHTAQLTQTWTAANCPEFISKDEWPPNSPDLNPLDFHI